ncbi:MAG: hypothetical protein K6F94_10090 [Bacteroidaceae bacterium]|nr:hypothetical protein [Bacteroidaceae bacterium]
MKTKHYILFALAMLMSIGLSHAQNVNKLYIPELTALPGTEITVPIYVDNTDELVAVQFDIAVPENSSLITSSAKLANLRTADHAVTFRSMGNNTYKALVYSPTNSALKGSAGSLLTVTMSVSQSYSAGEQYIITPSNVVLSMRDGSNVASEAEASKLTIIKGPDLQVTGITTDATTYRPNGEMTVKWNVVNNGMQPTQAGWTEEVSIVNAQGSVTKVATASYAESLAVGQALSRQTTVSLPEILGMDGAANIQVEVIPLSTTGESEADRANNKATSEQGITLTKYLKMEMASTISEPFSDISGKNLPVKITRTGNWSEAQTFTITPSRSDSRLNIPATVTIPAGQSSTTFYIGLTDNNVLDSESAVTVSVSGNDYDAIQSELVINDNEHPTITVATSNNQLTEGDAFTLTFTVDRAPKENLIITVSDDSRGRFSYATTLTIPAGKTSATLDVSAVNDSDPQLETIYEFKGTASGHNTGSVLVTLKDDDMPELEFTLEPTSVSEDDGTVCVHAYVRRIGKLSNVITIRLSDDSDGQIHYDRTWYEMPKGAEMIDFYMGVNDDDIVNGDRTVNITAAVWISSCSCNASGESAGYKSAKLAILDNDAPALGISSTDTSVKEGQTFGITISRNDETTSSNPLNITISTDDDDAFASYNHSLVIPAGSMTATLRLTTLKNDVQNDSRGVSIMASAEGYSTANAFINITDQTLPDATVTLSVEPSEVMIEGDFNFTIKVGNEGVATLPAGTAVSFSAFNVTKSLVTTAPIAVGGTEVIKVTVKAPSELGSATCYAAVNRDNKVTELNTYNNTASVRVSTTPPFTATVKLDKSIYETGENVQISGKLSGQMISNADVEVYVINDGGRQIINTKSDNDGNFTASFTPYTAQMGHFKVGARYPNDSNEEEQASFEIYGLRRASASQASYSQPIKHDEIVAGNEVSGWVSFYNPSSLDLTGAKATVVSKPDNVAFSVNISETLAGGSYTRMTYKFTPEQASPTGDWEIAMINLTTDQGATLEFPIYFHVLNPSPDLRASTSLIKSTMLRGGYFDYSVTLTNRGQGETGNISLSLPDFVTSPTGTSVTSLKQNESVSIVLRFTPTDDMQLNSPQKGQIAFNCDNGNGGIIKYEMTPVSEAKGKLVVDVMDEYTYQSEDGKHVVNATVEVLNPVTKATIVQGNTNRNGIYTVDLNEGYYTINVYESTHETAEPLNILVSPDTINNVKVNLSVNGIKVSWSVKNIEVEDEYIIKTNVSYTANLPVPTVVLSLPDIDAENLQPGQSLYFNATLSNYGLAKAINTTLSMPEGLKNFTFEPQEPNTGLTIPAQSSVTIPIKVTRNASDGGEVKAAGPRRAADIDGDPCITKLNLIYHWLCGTDTKYAQYESTLRIGACKISTTQELPASWIPTTSTGTTGSTTSYGGYGGYSGYSGYVGTPSSGSSTSTYSATKTANIVSVTEETGCEPCQAAFMQKMTKCVVKRLPLVKEVLGFIDNVQCAYDVISSGSWCWVERLPIVSTFVEYRDFYKECISPLFMTCGGVMPESDGLFSKRTSGDEDSDMPSYIIRYQDKTVTATNAIAAAMRQADEVLGDTLWHKYNTDIMTDVALNIKGLLDGEIDEEQFLKARPDSVDLNLYVNLSERILNTINGSDSENVIDINVVKEMEQYIVKAQEEADEVQIPRISDYYEEAEKEVMEGLEKATKNVCATISLEFTQQLVMTRQAFRGTLKVVNGHQTNPMSDVKLNLEVRNTETGDIATSDMMSVLFDAKDTFGGEDNFTSGWTLAAGATGRATAIFVPSDLAAPTTATKYAFGGTLSYHDPFSDSEVTRQLTPVILSVLPTAKLELTYFLQRDVYADDPLTATVVEESEPAEFALLVNNVGYGEAKRMLMLTQQPEIVENEREVPIVLTFESGAVNGKAKSPTLENGALSSDFGTIAPRSTAYAQWWLKSNKLVKLDKYEVTAEHIQKDYSSLIDMDKLSIHELIHSIKLDGGERVGFVVNDDEDENDMPDHIYLTDGSVNTLSIATAASESKGENKYLLTVTSSATGWAYGSLFDPTRGNSTITSIRRTRDGAEIDLRNFWQTDRTIKDGQDWVRDPLIHFADSLVASEETYELTFEPKPHDLLTVSKFENVPETPTTTPVEKVIVRFNKDLYRLDESCFRLTLQGYPVENYTVKEVGPAAVEVVLGEASKSNGLFMLTVFTSKMKDTDLRYGTNDMVVSWTQEPQLPSVAFDKSEVETIYGKDFEKPQLVTSLTSQPTYKSSNPLVAVVDSLSGAVTMKAVGNANITATLKSELAGADIPGTYSLNILQPEGYKEAGTEEYVTVTIPDGCNYVTFCTQWPVDFSNMGQTFSAFIVTDITNDSRLKCEKVMEACGGTGLIIKGTPGATYQIPVVSTDQKYEENGLIGTLAPTYVVGTTDDGVNHYYMEGDVFVPMRTSVIPSGKAYLPVRSNASSLPLQYSDAISGLAADGETPVWNRLDGTRTSKPIHNGIYVREGEKVIMK